eukprot:6455460-Amphidinium_carterae.1
MGQAVSTAFGPTAHNMQPLACSRIGEALELDAVPSIQATVFHPGVGHWHPIVHCQLPTPLMELQASVCLTGALRCPSGQLKITLVSGKVQH